MADNTRYRNLDQDYSSYKMQNKVNRYAFFRITHKKGFRNSVSKLISDYVVFSPPFHRSVK